MQSKLYTLLALTLAITSASAQTGRQGISSPDAQGAASTADSPGSSVSAQDVTTSASDIKSLLDYSMESVNGEEVYTVDGFGRFPIIPFGLSDGNKHRVVGAYKYLPLLDMDGKTERGNSKTSFVFERAARYSKGFIRTEDVSSLSINEDFGQDRTRVTGKAISDRDLKNVYFAVVIYDNRLNYGVNFGEVGDLKKGEATNFRLEVPNVRTTYSERDWRDNMYKFITEGELESNEARFFLIFFQDGLEVASVFSGTTSNFFNQQRFLQYSKKLEEHVAANEGKDAKLQIVDMQQPFFGDIESENKPERLMAEITFAPSGLVDKVALSGDTDCDAAYKKELVRAIRNWFVFPKLVNGEPVETTVKAPFQIGGSS